MPERQHPAEQAEGRPLAPAGILALARNRTAPLLRVADQRGSDVERSEEQTEALAHTTRLAAGRRCVHRRRRPPCAHPHRRISRLERPRWRRVSRKTRPQNCPVTGRKRAPGAIAFRRMERPPARCRGLPHGTRTRSDGTARADDRFRRRAIAPLPSTLPRRPCIWAPGITLSRVPRDAERRVAQAVL